MMINLKNILYFSVIFLLVLNTNGFGQVKSEALFLSKKIIKDQSIHEIKAFVTSTENAASDRPYWLFKFNKGLIVKEAFVSEELYGSVEDAILNGYQYRYSQYPNIILTGKSGHADAGPGDQDYFSVYKYLDKKMKLIIDGYNYSHREVSNNLTGSSNLNNLTDYFYSQDQKINYKVDYEVDIKGKSLSDLQVSHLINWPESPKLSNLLSSIHAIETGRIYFLYQDDNIVGYYPAKSMGNITENKIDSIYYQDKIKEVKEIGFESFKNKYFTKQVYQKIVDDCYTPVKSNELLINGKPLKEFLSRTGKSGVKYAVFEIYDNRFLFYKLID